MTSSDGLALLILAAGKGTRMRNDRGKVLHPLAGRSLIGHVVDLANQVQADRVAVVLAPGMDAVEAEVRRWRADSSIALQTEALGTGHAVHAALDLIDPQGTVVVLFGDTPLITAQTLEKLKAVRERDSSAVVVMGMRPPGPHKYGRLKFNAAGSLIAIVEHVDADDDLRRNALCNSGVMAIDAARCRELIEAIEPQAGNGEFYLTDIVALAVAKGLDCQAIEVSFEEGHGVNSQNQLAQANSILQSRLRERLLEAGVIMQSPETVQLAFDTRIMPGAEIEPYVVFGPGVEVGSKAKIRSFSHIEGSQIGDCAIVGPYARLRPGTELGADSRIGNFVETKNAKIAQGAKANHLTYLGDCEIGTNSNIGAGTITCNYDGFNKSKTMIGSNVFVGSNTALVAPVNIGDGALIGAGSTITKDVAADGIGLSRSAQELRQGAAPLLRQRLARKKTLPKG